MSEDSKKRSIDESTAEPEFTEKKTELTLDDVKSKLKVKNIQVVDLNAAPDTIPRHELVVVSILDEDGDPCARIKNGPLSNAERVLFDFMRTHGHDDFKELLQKLIIDIECYVLGDMLEARIKKLIYIWNNQNNHLPLPFTKEQLWEYMIEVADESLKWYTEYNMRVINRCMTMPGALCMMMTSHN